MHNNVEIVFSGTIKDIQGCLNIIVKIKNFQEYLGIRRNPALK